MAMDFVTSIEDFSNFSGWSTVVSISIFASVLCLCILVGHLLEEHRWVNESITVILIGFRVGAIISFLPPIIFNAGFQVKKKQFFHNFLTIMSFGVLGVFISFTIISVGFEGLNLQDYLRKPMLH